MTILDAIKEAKNNAITGVRGLGCARIIMADGRQYNIHPAGDLLERYNDAGELIERDAPEYIRGNVARIDWSVDELGGIYG